MPPPSDASSGEIRIGVFYDFSRKELLLRFDSSAYARAYQAKNPEGRILADNRKEVWLPLCDSMRTLRSSDGFGMVIIFRSKEERRKWLDRSVLGEDVNTSDGEYGVRFKRNWSRTEIEKALDYPGSLRDSLQVPKDKQEPHSRPGSRQEKNHPRQPQYAPVESPPSNRPAYFEPVQSPGSTPFYMPVESKASRPRRLSNS
jgi:hypothetical protein